MLKPLFTFVFFCCPELSRVPPKGWTDQRESPLLPGLSSCRLNWSNSKLRKPNLGNLVVLLGAEALREAQVM